MTRLAIGEGGMLRVVHLIHLSRTLPHFNSGIPRATGHTQGHTQGGTLGSTQGGSGTVGGGGGTQRGTGMMVPVTFIAYPEEEEEEEEAAV